jgi:hypothetical protein
VYPAVTGGIGIHNSSSVIDGLKEHSERYCDESALILVGVGLPVRSACGRSLQAGVPRANSYTKGASYGPLSTASLTEVAIDRREMAFPLGHMWFCVPAILPAEKDYFWPPAGAPGRASARARGVIFVREGRALGVQRNQY